MPGQGRGQKCCYVYPDSSPCTVEPVVRVAQGWEGELRWYCAVHATELLLPTLAKVPATLEEWRRLGSAPHGQD
jgi:hypothetical protein